MAVMTTQVPYTWFDWQYGPGVLYSERSGTDFTPTLMLIFAFVVPMTLLFMLGGAHIQWRMVVHIVLTCVMIVIFIVSAGLWSVLLAHANEDSDDYSRNPANDGRYCCVYTGRPGCNASAVCDPGVSSSMLGFNPFFVAKYVFNWIFIVLFVIELAMTLCWFRPCVKDYVLEATATVIGTTTDEQPEPPRRRQDNVITVQTRLPTTTRAPIVAPTYMHKAPTGPRMGGGGGGARK